MNSSVKKNSIYNAIKTISTIIFPLITFPYISRVLLVDNIGKINFGSSIIVSNHYFIRLINPQNQ